MISVAICTYNGALYIAEQLHSVIHQTKPPDEIVVCDDFSSDVTTQIVDRILMEWGGSYQLVINDHNLGFKNNFVKAIGLCHGDIIFLCDQDDVWKLNKIEYIDNVFQNHPKAIMIFHDAVLVDCELKTLYPSFWGTMYFDSQDFLNNNYSRLVFGNVIQGAACAFRKELYTDALPFCNAAYHDEWLGLMAVAKGDILPINQSLLLYRQHCNVIGGMPLTRFQKIVKWTLHMKSSLVNRYAELMRRMAIFNAYENKTYQDRTVVLQKMDYIPYKNFLNKRTTYINRHSLRFLWLFKAYYRYNQSLINTVTDMIQDVFTLFIKLDKR